MLTLNYLNTNGAPLILRVFFTDNKSFNLEKILQETVSMHSKNFIDVFNYFLLSSWWLHNQVIYIKSIVLIQFEYHLLHQCYCCYFQ